MHNYKNLKIWQSSRILVKQVYELTANFPINEKFGLISQIQRAVVSIPANIAEGSGRGSNKEFSRYLDIAISSSFELETELLLAHDLSFLNDSQIAPVIQLIQEIQKMIFGFKETIKVNEITKN
jgi:four helix bundle protein